MPEERWRPVRGFEGAYEVSDHGCIRNFRSGKRLKPIPDKDSYLVVNLSQSGRRKRGKIHKLVAEAFIGEQPSSEHEVRHLDGDRSNNLEMNLAWGTGKENWGDRYRHGTHHGPAGENHPGHKLTEAQVTEIRAEAALGRTQREIARRYGICQQMVSNIVTGKNWTTARPSREAAA